MNHSILFAAPKRGGILQSSGFLDLKSLMALNLTCKSNAYDELSLILLIENELTRNHGVQTIEEATSLWRKVYRNSLLKRWMNRNDTTTDEPIRVTRQMLSETVYHCFEVMFHKMLRAVPESERLQMVREPYVTGWTLFHYAADMGNLEATRAIIDLYPEPERLHATRVQDSNGCTVLHCAAKSGSVECIKAILSLYPELERLQALGSQDKMGETILHCAARSGNCESLEAILALYPKAQHLQAVGMRDTSGGTVLHHTARSDNLECINTILSIYPKSEHFDVLNDPDRFGMTPVHYVVSESDGIESIKAILDCFSESELARTLCMKDHKRRTVLHFASVKSPEYMHTILDRCPESERLQVLDMTDRDGFTALHCAARENNVDCIKAILSFYPESQHQQMQNRWGIWNMSSFNLPLCHGVVVTQFRSKTITAS